MASSVAEDLKNRRLNIWNEAKAIIEDAADENRDMSPEEQGRWEGRMVEIDKLDARLQGRPRSRAAVARTPTRRSTRSPASGPRSRVAQHADSNGRDVSTEVRSFLKGEAGQPRAMEFRHNPALGPINYRTLQSNTSTPTSLVPTDFYDQLIAHLIEVSGVMQTGPTVINTSGGENAADPEDDHPHDGRVGGAGGRRCRRRTRRSRWRPSARTSTATCIRSPASCSTTTALTWSATSRCQAGRALGNKFGSDLVTGTGTAQPTGFMTSATIGVTGTTTGKCGAAQYADLVDLEYCVIAPYRQSRSCYWIAADKTIGGFRKIAGRATRGRSGSRRRSSAPRTCCSASRWSRTRSCRRWRPAASRSRSATSASSSCGWSAGSGSSGPTTSCSARTWSRSAPCSVVTVCWSTRPGAIKTYKGPAT